MDFLAICDDVSGQEYRWKQGGEDGCDLGSICCRAGTPQSTRAGRGVWLPAAFVCLSHFTIHQPTTTVTAVAALPIHHRLSPGHQKLRDGALCVGILLIQASQ